MASVLVASPAKYMQLLQATAAHMRFIEPSGHYVLYWKGMRVQLEAPSGFCRCCGAPAEVNECSYCHTPSEYMEVRDEG